MIRVIFRWRVKPGDEEQFVHHWHAGTRKIQDNCAGAHGSCLIRDRKSSEHFFGVARWESGSIQSANAVTTANIHSLGGQGGGQLARVS